MFPNPSQNPFALDTRGVGEVVQSPINLEQLTNGKFLLLDGRDMLRSAAPELAQNFPAGVFTGTARTLNSAPAVSVIAADGTNFLACAPNGTSPIQASADGITWSASATWSGTNVASIIVAGSRYIMAGNTSGELATSPMVSNTGQTAANQVAKANWTATTVATTTTLTQGLAYGPTANAGAGRAVMIPDAAGTTIWTLDDGSTAWVARSHTTSRTKKSVVWTGQKFIAQCSDAPYNIILTSIDGVTWAEQLVPQVLNGTTWSMASDGAGTVVMSKYQNNNNLWFVVSKDHGATWRVVFPPPAELMGFVNAGGGYVNSYYYVYFVNGKFIAMPYNASNDQSSLISADGLTWFSAPLGALVPMASGTTPTAIAYKSGVYCGISAANTAAATWTEDVSRMRLPLSKAYGSSTTVGPGVLHNEYIKARSN